MCQYTPNEVIQNGLMTIMGPPKHNPLNQEPCSTWKNEEVIKMIINENNSNDETCLTTELHLNGCLTGSTWTSKIQIEYIDTKHQLADILTKGNFTRDEFNILLRLFNISNVSPVCCFETRCPISVSKRLQEGEGLKERVMAKSKSMITLVSRTVERSSTMPSSSASGSASGGSEKDIKMWVFLAAPVNRWQEMRRKTQPRALLCGDSM